MKTTGIVCMILVCCALDNPVWAQDYKGAIGIRFSSKAALVSNSVSLKYFFNEKTAAEGLITVSSPFALGLLLAQHKPVFTGFKYFYGGGIYAGFSGDRKLGLHGVIGLDYKVPALPVNFSIDWKPELTLASEFSFEPQALGVSLRFTIK